MIYEFTHDWFTSNADSWRKHVVPRLPRPFRWLEIGSCEGRSACWMLDEVMQSGDKITCVDVWPTSGDDVQVPSYLDSEARFDRNVAGRAEKVRSQSFDFLVQALAEQRRFDGIYVDGDHEAKVAIEDIMLSWRLLNVGGVMVIDDYEWPMPEGNRHLLPPKPAVDAFLAIYGSRLEVLHKAWQVIVTKRAE
jgi:predicted O-methyltransferase YrrM